jgi:hypothetical protein
MKNRQAKTVAAILSIVGVPLGTVAANWNIEYLLMPAVIVCSISVGMVLATYLDRD